MQKGLHMSLAVDACCVWLQVLTKGKGPLGQLGLPLNLPLNSELAGFGLAIWVGFFLVAGECMRLPKQCDLRTL